MLRLGDSKRPYENFINSIDSEYTKRSYKYHLGKFMAKQPKLTVETFLQLPTNQIEEMIIDYIIDLKKEGLSSIYIRLKLSSLRHLCVMNDVRINTEKIAKFIGERVKKNTDRAFTIRKLNRSSMLLMYALPDDEVKQIFEDAWKHQEDNDRQKQQQRGEEVPLIEAATEVMLAKHRFGYNRRNRGNVGL